MVFSLLPPRKFAIRTWFCNCPQYLCLFGIVFECSPSLRDPRKSSPKSTYLLNTFHIGLRFCFSSQFLCHPHTQIRIILFHDEQRDIPNLEFSHSHVSIGCSQIAFPTIILPKDDRTNSFQEERLGLPYWTMILAMCVVVDDSKCLDTTILEFSIIFEHLPFSLGYKLIMRLLLVHRNQAIWR